MAPRLEGRAAPSDLRLDEFMSKQKPDVRAAGEKAAQPWIDADHAVTLLTAAAAAGRPLCRRI